MQNIDTRLAGASPYSARLHGVKCNPGTVRKFGVQESRPRASLALKGIAKLTFMTGIAAGILFAWQGITLQVQKFSVRPDANTPVAAVARWVHNAWNAALHVQEAPVPPSSFAAELRMNTRQLIDRWAPTIATASARYNIPANWIRAVVQMESGGRTMLGENRPIVSRAGAMGLMQLMPGTYKLMRAQFGLGANPFNPRDNIYAGAAYLHQLYRRYGFPAMFAAYNDGPGHLEERLQRGTLLPLETRNYVNRIVTALNGGTAATALNGGTAARPAALQSGATAKFARPDGTPVDVKLADITAVRVPLRGEYPAGVNAVITIGRLSQGVREDYHTVKTAMLDHGALGQPVSGEAARFAALLAPNLIRASSGQRRGGHRHVVTGHRRVHGELRLAAADTGAIHLHPVSHRARS